MEGEGRALIAIIMANLVFTGLTQQNDNNYGLEEGGTDAALG